jgi:hypothetical protein
MRLLNISILVLLFFALISCNNKNIGRNNNSENNIHGFYQGNIIEMLHHIEYYKNEIIKYQDNYYGFKDVSMEITQLMNVSSINKIDNFIPDFLTFLVCWFNPKGNVYYLYTFDDNQNILNHYYCGDFVPFNNYKILMEKLTGKIIEKGAIAVGDYNNDGVNEIVLYTFYKNIGNVFCVYGFNTIDNKLEELCLVPVFINYDNPFPSAEYIGNGFKILEVFDEEFMELEWSEYIWENDKMKYIKK